MLPQQASVLPELIPPFVAQRDRGKRVELQPPLGRWRATFVGQSGGIPVVSRFDTPLAVPPRYLLTCETPKSESGDALKNSILLCVMLRLRTLSLFNFQLVEHFVTRAGSAELVPVRDEALGTPRAELRRCLPRGNSIFQRPLDGVERVSQSRRQLPNRLCHYQLQCSGTLRESLQAGGKHKDKSKQRVHYVLADYVVVEISKTFKRRVPFHLTITYYRVCFELRRRLAKLRGKNSDLSRSALRRRNPAARPSSLRGT